MTQQARSRPLVALVHSVPLVSEALAGSLSDVGDVCTFVAGSDTAGLLDWLRPDAVVVDREAEAAVAGAFAGSSGAVAMFLCPASGEVAVIGAEEGGRAPRVEATPEAVRNLLAGLLHAGGPAR